MKNVLRFLPLALLALFALASGCSESSDGESESCSDFEAEALRDASVCENSFVKTSCLGDGAAESYPNLAKACGDAAKDKDGDGDNEDEDPAPTPCEDNAERNVFCGLNNRDIGREVCVNGFFTLLPGSCTDKDECIDDTTETAPCTRDGFPGEKFRACNNGKWSDFTECHICDEGDTLECDIDSVFLVTPKRLCQPKNEYSDCTIVDFENDISGVLYYKESGDFLGETFTTTNHVEEFSVSFWMRFDEGTNTPIGIFALRSGGIHGEHLNLHTGSVICVSGYCHDDGSGYSIGPDPAERVQTPNVDNHIVVTMSQYYFRYYLNGEEITTITRGPNHIPQNPENGFDGFNSPGLPAGTEIELRRGAYANGVLYSHTTIIDGILSPADVALLYAKGPASP